jgi:hypothetical protein
MKRSRLAAGCAVVFALALPAGHAIARATAVIEPVVTNVAVGTSDGSGHFTSIRGVCSITAVPDEQGLPPAYIDITCELRNIFAAGGRTAIPTYTNVQTATRTMISVPKAGAEVCVSGLIVYRNGYEVDVPRECRSVLG